MEDSVFPAGRGSGMTKQIFYHLQCGTPGVLFDGNGYKIDSYETHA